ncbi:MAG: hypothetical protein KDI44_19400 [Thiothrix sp.]|nr:hypothetical protein [Thiothrix sp.]
MILPAGTPTLIDVQDLLALPKQTVSPMVWKLRTHRRGIEYHSDLLLKTSGVILQDTRLLLRYIVLPVPLPPSYNLILLLNNCRVYAIDVEPPEKQHRNTMAGAGRPYYGREVGHIHEHTWSKEGDGYAEPLVLSGQPAHREYWHCFAVRTNITVIGGYKNPADTLSGQIDFLEDW